MKLVLLGAALTATLLTGAASASPVNVDFQSNGGDYNGVFGANNLYQSVRVYDDVKGDRNLVAGMFHMTGDSGVGDFLSFCVDLNQYLKSSTAYTVNNNLFADPILSNVAKLFSTALGGATMAVAIDTKNKAAGFQIALWEIIKDSGSGFDLNDGDFKLLSDSTGVRSKAEGYLSDVLGAAAGGPYDLTFYYSQGYQDVVTGTPGPRGGGGPTPVPLPASGLLLAFGLSGLFAARRRRRSAS